LGRVEGAPIARPGDALDAVYRIAAHYDLNPIHPAQVEREVNGIVRDPGIGDASLVDLLHLPFVTIDNDDSRDLDQALAITKSSYGRGYIVWYALADASFYVRPRTALFREALKRGASFYLPGLVIPMLPRRLSEGLISLNEGQPRRALVF